MAKTTTDKASLPRPVIFCGPSGVGKGTLIDMMMKEFPNKQFGFSVSHTTRKPREGEVDGVHYNFSTVDKVKKEIDEGKFIEYAEVHGNYYGTSVEAVESVRNSGKVCILDIDYQGVQNVKKSSLDPYYLFIAPPSMEALEKRLRSRGTEKEEDIVKRLGNAAKELEYGKTKGNFDKIITNDDLNKAFTELLEIFKEWYPHLKPVEKLRPIVFCAPSAIARKSLYENIAKNFPNDQIGFCVSHTTRKPREGEVDGVHYNFSTFSKVKKLIDEGEFAEYAEVNGNYYGTSLKAVQSIVDTGKICVIDIDYQGVENMKKSDLNPYYVFIAPKSMESLELKLKKKFGDNEDEIIKRLLNAKKEMEYGETDGNFDKVLVYNGLESATAVISGFLLQSYPNLDYISENKDDETEPKNRICAQSSCSIM